MINAITNCDKFYAHPQLYKFALLLSFLILASISHSVLADKKEFDHFSTGYPLSGMHFQVKCEACHIRGVFKGTPRQCASCHNGQIANGKPMKHIRSPNLCDDCHTTFAWEAATFDHSSVTGTCGSCHNGSTATGKPGRHILTSLDCEECHITTVWLPARFNHDDLIGSCRGCHIDDMPPPPEHPATSGDCDACHLTTAWKPARFDHDAAVGICRSCHLKDLPSNHTAIGSLECDECHTNTTWVLSGHNHAFFAIEHDRELPCDRCHTAFNPPNIIWTSRQYEPDCAGCHANDFRPDSHKPEADSDATYTVDELRDCAGPCHKEGVPQGAGHHAPNKSW
ncbi:hypothetical protein [Kaarinaea lacus]